MKTIFDKIDSNHIECVSGLCEHTGHQFNLIYLIIIPVVVIGYMTYKKYIES